MPAFRFRVRPRARTALLVLLATVLATGCGAFPSDPFGAPSPPRPLDPGETAHSARYEVLCFVSCTVHYTTRTGSKMEDVEGSWSHTETFGTRSAVGTVTLRVTPGAGDRIRRATITVDGSLRAERTEETSTVTMSVPLRDEDLAGS